MLLDIKNLTHAFDGRTVIDDISFALQEGEIISILGPSGCGKSTLLRLIAGLEKVQQGEIYIRENLASQALTQIAPEKRGVGLVFQDYALFPHLSILENVLYGIPSAQKREGLKVAHELLTKVELLSHAHFYPNALSGGQQQRIALIRALAAKPACLCLDEPFSGLDGKLRKEVRDQTILLLKENKQGALLVTHDAEEAALVSDRILVMNQGRVEQLGTAQDLSLKPHSSFVAEFLGLAQVLHFPNAHPFLRWASAQNLPSELETHSAYQVAIYPEAITFGEEVRSADETLPLVATIANIVWCGSSVIVSFLLPTPFDLILTGTFSALRLNEIHKGKKVSIKFNKRGLFFYPQSK